MKQLGKIKNLPQEIIQQLSFNTNLQKLLLIDTQDPFGASDFSPLSWDKLIETDYMSIAPIVDDNITNIGRNSFLIVHLDDINMYDWEDNISVSGAIFIGTNLEHCWLKGNKLRLLEMIDEITKTLDGQKFSVAGKAQINRASSIVYSNKSFGYRISFTITDQENRKAEL